MKILSHRGYWVDHSEKNTQIAFDRSFSLGFGTETDVRDYNGNLVISHDTPTGSEVTFDTFLNLADTHANYDRITLALNIKADGLASLVENAIKDYKRLDCFVFDMSVPDMRDYFDRGIQVFTRISEVEKQPVWFERSAGVWLDSFEFEWFSNSLIEDLLESKKRICIVSPELHRRDHSDFWKSLKPLAKESQLMLCTDYPELASNYFE